MLTRRSLLSLLAGASLPSWVTAATPPSIVATTGMIADAAGRISGLPVVGLMGPGMDPHGHRPTRSDILALSRADLVLWHGLNLEAQFSRIMGDLAANKPVVAVAEGVQREHLLADPDYPDRPDPHVWFDPTLWAEVTKTIEAAVMPFAPDAESFGQAYREEISTLASYAVEVMATIPGQSRVLITAHDAFSYFGRAFGIEVMGIQGISTDSEAGLSRIAELVGVLVHRKVPAVFVESSVSDRSIRALIEGAAAQGHRVEIGGELYSDAMGPEGSYEGSYLGMFDHNVTIIARALGGRAPERGALGKLGLAG